MASSKDKVDTTLANTVAWRGKEIIALIDDRLSKPIMVNDDWSDFVPTDKDDNDGYSDILSEATYDFIGDYDNTDASFSTWVSIFKLLGKDLYQELFQDTYEVRMKIASLFEGAAIALSSNIEYSPAVPMEEYMARSFIYSGSSLDSENRDLVNSYIPYSLMVDKDTKEKFLVRDMNDAIKEGFTFGPYQIRKYDSLFLKTMFPNTNVNFKGFDFLDPYYNKTLNPTVDQNDYKKKLMMCPRYSVEAFSRITLVWIKMLIQNNALINYFDVNRDEYEKQFTDLYQAIYHSKTTSHGGLSSTHLTDVDRDNMKKIKGFMDATKDYGYQLVLGKIFAAITLAVTDGDGQFLEKMLRRDTGSLDNMVASCSTNINAKLIYTVGQRKFRKLVRSLIVTKPALIDGDLSAIGGKMYTSPLEEVVRDNSEKLWVDASNDPSMWVMHSYYDMVTNNKRGRMARAFPTYYMMFIDEGREIGYWKIRDNFYDISAISEIEITKSRKMPVETATIGLTNMFKTYTTDDADVKTDYQNNMRDVFNSIFSPRTYFNKLEDKRNEQMNINKIKLKPGARVHLRMGYSGDASTLPILFNGVVAEVAPGEIMKLTCESDGHELVNNGVFGVSSAEDAAELLSVHGN